MGLLIKEIGEEMLKRAMGFRCGPMGPNIKEIG